LDPKKKKMNVLTTTLLVLGLLPLFGCLVINVILTSFKPDINIEITISIIGEEYEVAVKNFLFLALLLWSAEQKKSKMAYGISTIASFIIICSWLTLSYPNVRSVIKPREFDACFSDYKECKYLKSSACLSIILFIVFSLIFIYSFIRFLKTRAQQSGGSKRLHGFFVFNGVLGFAIYTMGTIPLNNKFSLEVMRENIALITMPWNVPYLLLISLSLTTYLTLSNPLNSTRLFHRKTQILFALALSVFVSTIFLCMTIFGIRSLNNRTLVRTPVCSDVNTSTISYTTNDCIAARAMVSGLAIVSSAQILLSIIQVQDYRIESHESHQESIYQPIIQYE